MEGGGSIPLAEWGVAAAARGVNKFSANSRKQYVNIYTYTYIYMYIYICICAYIHMCILMYRGMNVYICTYIHMCVRVYICARKHTYSCTSVHVEGAVYSAPPLSSSSPSVVFLSFFAAFRLHKKCGNSKWNGETQSRERGELTRGR